MIEHTCNTFEQDHISLPDETQMQQIEAKYANAGFPGGCVGCIDVLNVPQTGSPAAQRGSVSRKDGTPTIAVEGVYNRLLRAYPVFAERPGASNGLNVLAHSPIWDKTSTNNFTANDVLRFSIDGQEFSQPYLLADGTYPKRPLAEPLTSCNPLSCLYRSPKLLLCAVETV